MRDENGYGFRRNRDQAVADESSRGAELSCSATGCPNAWSVSFGGGRGQCSAHAWVDVAEWPRITREQQDMETDRALSLQRAKPATQRWLSKDEKTAALQRIRAVFARIGSGAGRREWAYKLRARERQGEHLTMAQREAWRAVIDANDALDAAKAGAPVLPAVIDLALQVTGDIPLPDDDVVPHDEPAHMREYFDSDPRFAAWVAGATA